MDTDNFYGIASKYMKIAAEMQEREERAGVVVDVCVELSDWIGEVIEDSSLLDVGYLTALKDMLDKPDGVIEKINS